MDAALFARAAGIGPPRAQQWYSAVANAMAEYGIASSACQAAFIAQCGHESMGYARTREIWGPTPTQQRYEGRADLGNTEPGDGRRFMGRGLIMVTGRGNYRRCGNALGVDFVANPPLLELPAYAAQSAAWFWADHELNALAEAGKFEALTRAINGGLNGYDDRFRRWHVARDALAGASL